MSDTAQALLPLSFGVLQRLHQEKLEVLRPIASGMNFLSSLPCGEGGSKRQETSKELIKLIDAGKETFTAILDNLMAETPPADPGYKTTLNELTFLRVIVSQWQELNHMHASPKQRETRYATIEAVEWAYHVETERWIKLRERLSMQLQINLAPQPEKTKGDQSEGESLPPFRHSPDFRGVHWYGTEYTFTPTQAAVVRILWEAFEKGTPEVGGVSLLDSAGSSCERLRDVFRKHPAWDTMIVKGTRRGSYCLKPLS